VGGTRRYTKIFESAASATLERRHIPIRVHVGRESDALAHRQRHLRIAAAGGGRNRRRLRTARRIRRNRGFAARLLRRPRSRQRALARLRPNHRRATRHFDRHVFGRVLEALIKSGALDGLAANRATLMHRLDGALALGEQNSKANETGQHDIFGLSTAQAPDAVRVKAPDQPEWTDSVRLRAERETLGRAISGHPIDRFVNDLPRFITGRIADYLEAEKPTASAEGGRAFFGGKPVAIAGVVEELRKRGPRTEVLLDDDSGRIAVSFFDEQYQQFRELLVKDALLLIEGKVRFDEFANTWVLRASKVSELERLREKEARRIVLKLKASDGLSLDKLQAVLAQYRGGNCHLAVQFHGDGARGTFSFGADWNVKPTPALIEELEGLLGRGRIAVLYSPPPQSAGVTSIGG